MKNCTCRIILLLYCIFHCHALGQAAASNISFDGSLGPKATLGGPNFVIPASMGTQVGSNLFHSFDQFNLANGGTANFSGIGQTAPIANIIARVTGGPSSIDGTITSDIAGVNLYLLNPAGIMFGAHAQINIPGAFTTGTPDYVNMAGGVGKFYTSLGGNDVLTTASVSAFGFLHDTPQTVQFNRSQLTFATGATVNVIGGDITFDGARLSGEGGNLNIFSARSRGEVASAGTNSPATLGASTVGNLGDVVLKNRSTLAISSMQGGGHVLIRGGSMVFENLSRVISANSGSAVGGDIELQAKTVSFLDNSSLFTEARSIGPAGNIQVTAADLTIDGTASPSSSFLLKAGLASDSRAGATGNAGNITATISDLLTVKGGGQIASYTYSLGAAGNIDVQTTSLSIDGSSTPHFLTLISSASQSTASGVGGQVSIHANGAVSVSEGGSITADTFSSGNAGEVDLWAQTLTIVGSSVPHMDGVPDIFTGVSSSSNEQARGNGGALNLTITGDIFMNHRGAISTATTGSGDAGKITLHAANLTIDSQGIAGFTGIASQAQQNSTGKGGDIDLHVSGQVKLVNAGVISADTQSPQRGGDLSLEAGSLVIDGSLAPDRLTGISSSTGKHILDGGALSNGQGGNIEINVASNLSFMGGGIEEESFSNGNAGTLRVTVNAAIDLSNGGFISGDAFANGTGGTVIVTAPSIHIDGSGPLGASAAVETLTGIASDSNAHFSAVGTGQGGDVSVTATQSLTIVNGGRIAALTETQGNGGSVVVIAPVSVTLAGADSQISSSSTSRDIVNLHPGTAGSVSLVVGTLELDENGSIATSAAAADAGSIEITANDEVTLRNGGNITTSAAADGGNIHLQVERLVYLSRGQISATAGALQLAGEIGHGGNIVIDPQFVVLNNSSISANAAIGRGGDITIITNNFLNSSSLLTATGSTNGTIAISAPDLDLSGDLIPLSAVLVSDTNQLRESCARSVKYEFSSFTVVGRSGTESAPNELQPDFGLDALPLATSVGVK